MRIAGLFRVEGSNNVRVLQPGCRLSLAAEALGGPRFGHEFGTDHLDCHLPPHHAFRRPFAAVVERQADALIALQDAGGHWHTVVDRADTYLESSIAAMMAWALGQAVRLGALPASKRDLALRAAESARAAALAATDADGRLTGVSEATPAGDLAAYAARPTGVFPWGQGPLLLALADAVAPEDAGEAPR